MGLITTARAKQSINQSTFTAAEDTQITTLIEAASNSVKMFCGRDFASTAYDELYSGDGGPVLALRRYPLLGVSRVAGGPADVLAVQNTSAAVQRATVQVTSTGLTLTHVASGVSSANAVAFAGNATLAAVAAAVNAVGSGWLAAVTSGYESWASADLRAVQGALDARAAGGCTLRVHVEELADFDADAERGLLHRRGAFAAGTDNYRVVYTAGNAAVPEAVQEACAQWVAGLFWMTKANPPDYPMMPTPCISAMLAPYRRLLI